jgi:hypothetical protein
VSYAWDSRVLSFDVEGQREFFAHIGMANVPGGRLLLWVGAGVALLLAAYVLLLAWRGRGEADVVRKHYESFCRKLARLGAERRSCEGPSDYSARAALYLPGHAAAIERIAELYIALRYAPTQSPKLMTEFDTKVRAFPRGMRSE